jgi:hypothetical protein
MVVMSETVFVFFLVALGFMIFVVGFLVGNIAAMDTSNIPTPNSRGHIELAEKLEIPIPEPPRPQVKGETIEGPISADPP